MDFRLRALTDELGLAEAVVSALARREEFLGIRGMVDHDQAEQQLETALGIAPEHAHRLLTMPSDVISDEQGRRLEVHADELRQRNAVEHRWQNAPEPRPGSRNLNRYGPNDLDEAARVLEPIVHSVIRPDELEELAVYWQTIPRGDAPGFDAWEDLRNQFEDENPLYLWVRIQARGEEFARNVWSPSYRTGHTIPWTHGVEHFVEALEDWLAERKFVRGQRRLVNARLRPGPD